LKRRYFDNAATSFPKPPEVLGAMEHYARHIGASAGRGVYQEALESGDMIHQTRCRIAKLIGASNPDHIILTLNCTDGLVTVIKGLLTTPGGHVITTRMDHNSVLRPLSALHQQLGIEITHVPADSRGLVDPDDIRRAIRPDTRLIAVVHGSNVCGSLVDIEAVGRIAREHGIFYLVDAAQTIGHLPIDVRALQVDAMAFPGHKALLGPLGTGVLYIRPGVEMKIRPLKEGGTGSRSEEPVQPDFMPDRFEAGSHNAIGIAGLGAGVQFILKKGIQNLRNHEEHLCRIFLDETESIDGLTVYGPRNLIQRVGVFSVRLDGFEPAELSAVLEEKFGILTRPGLHCAPLAHQSLGTLDRGGTTRFSLGCFLTDDDIHYAADALRQIAHACMCP